MIPNKKLIELLDDESLYDILCVIHDSILELKYIKDKDNDEELSPRLLTEVLYQLPSDIIFEANEWGAQDTLVREQIYEFIRDSNNLI